MSQASRQRKASPGRTAKERTRKSNQHPVLEALEERQFLSAAPTSGGAHRSSSHLLRHAHATTASAPAEHGAKSRGHRVSPADGPMDLTCSINVGFTTASNMVSFSYTSAESGELSWQLSDTSNAETSGTYWVDGGKEAQLPFFPYGGSPVFAGGVSTTLDAGPHSFAIFLSDPSASYASIATLSFTWPK